MGKRKCTSFNYVLKDELDLYKTGISASLSEQFTEQVMEKVQQTELLPASGAEASEWAVMRSKRRARLGLRWGGVALSASIAVVLLLYFIPGLINTTESTSFLQPVTQMSWRPSQQASQWSDIGLTEAQALGLVQQPSVRVVDKNYTLSLEEVIADDSRLVLSLQVYDESGQAIDAWISGNFDARQLRIKNEAGEDIAYFRSDIPMESKANPDKSQKLWMTYAFTQTPGDSVIIEGNFRKLYIGGADTEPLTGNWSFAYRADMTKAKNSSVATALDDSYITPAGLKLDMQQLVRTPTGAQLQLDTSFSDEAKALTPENLRKQLSLNYHFEDENGQKLTDVNDYGIRGYTEFYLGKFMTENTQTGTQNWTYSFPFLPYDSMRIHFVLDSYSLPVQSEDSVTFQPEKLMKQPVIFEAHGDVLKIHEMEVKERSDGSGLSGQIIVSGEMVNSFKEDRWIARDEAGKEYEVEFVGHLRLGDTMIIDEPMEGANSPSYFEVLGMTSMPKELTLIRTVTDKKYTNVDWSFELPKIERKEVLKDITIPPPQD